MPSDSVSFCPQKCTGKDDKLQDHPILLVFSKLVGLGTHYLINDW